MVEREEGGVVAFRPVSPSWPCRGAAAYSTIALAYFLHKLHNNILFGLVLQGVYFGMFVFETELGETAV